jgi:hypothetical protein
MSKRKPIYDTGHTHKTQVIKKISVNNIKIIDSYVLQKMNEYKIKHNKNFFECSYNTIIDVVAQCVNFFEGVEIDKMPDIKINRQDNLLFDKNKIVKIKILTDEEFNELLLQNDEQTGGNTNYLYSYLKYKLKYLELKYNLFEYDI